MAHQCPSRNQYQQPMGMIKKSVQQGRSQFDARSILTVCEHGKMARTPLTEFFNIPRVIFFNPQRLNPRIAIVLQ